jgi:hypothetical protein
MTTVTSYQLKDTMSLRASNLWMDMWRGVAFCENVCSVKLENLRSAVGGKEVSSDMNQGSSITSRG